jgi:hypothetical protein
VQWLLKALFETSFTRTKKFEAPKLIKYDVATSGIITDEFNDTHEVGIYSAKLYVCNLTWPLLVTLYVF